MLGMIKMMMQVTSNLISKCNKKLISQRKSLKHNIKNAFGKILAAVILKIMNLKSQKKIHNSVNIQKFKIKSLKNLCLIQQLLLSNLKSLKLLKIKNRKREDVEEKDRKLKKKKY